MPVCWKALLLQHCIFLFQYVNRNETKYTLLINYTLSVGPEMTLYYHSAEVECVIADIGKLFLDINRFASTA